MTKEQFLSELREALDGSISPSAVNDNVRYYDEYIETEERKGRSSEEIMEELGEPRLIARTIIDTSDISDKRGAESVQDSYADASDNTYSGDKTGSGDYRNVYRRGIQFKRVSGLRVLAVLAIILIIFLVVFTFAIWLVGSFIMAFWPAILVAAALWWIFNPVKWD